MVWSGPMFQTPPSEQVFHPDGGKRSCVVSLMEWIIAVFFMTGVLVNGWISAMGWNGLQCDHVCRSRCSSMKRRLRAWASVPPST